MAVRELWPVASRTKPACRVECSRTRWGSVGCWGMALTSTCTSLEWAACVEPLEQQLMILVFFVFFNSKILTGKCIKVLLTWRQAERKLGLKVTSLTVKVLVGYHHHHSFTPAGKRGQKQILIGGVETHLEHKFWFLTVNEAFVTSATLHFLFPVHPKKHSRQSHLSTSKYVEKEQSLIWWACITPFLN